MMTQATPIGKADADDSSDRPRQSLAAVIVPAGTPGPDGHVRPYDVRADAYDLLYDPRPDPAPVRYYDRRRAALIRRKRLARPARKLELLRLARRIAMLERVAEELVSVIMGGRP